LPANDVVIVPVHGQRGTGFVGLARHDGTLRWTIDPGLVPTTAAWLVVDGLLIVNGESGESAAVRVVDGVTSWRRQFERNSDNDVPRHLDPVLRSGALFIPQRGVHVVRPHDGYPLGSVPCDLVPDLVRVDERCNVLVVEESGHLAAFAAGTHLTLVKG
jgi:hypothetical protein